MANVYTAWPTRANLATFLTGSNITPALTDTDMLDGLIAAAAQRITKATNYQWVAGSAGEVRYYDGSGTGLQQIDEYVDVSAVEFVLYPQATGVSVTSFVEVSRNNFPNSLLQIYQGATHATVGYLDRFPKGRSNIKVTAQFGYASAIPYDVWMAVLKKSAADVSAMNAMAAQGKAVAWDEGDVSERYSDKSPGEAAGWVAEFETVCKRRRKPYSHRQRMGAPGLV